MMGSRASRVFKQTLIQELSRLNVKTKDPKEVVYVSSHLSVNRLEGAQYYNSYININNTDFFHIFPGQFHKGIKFLLKYSLKSSLLVQRVTGASFIYL